VWDYVFGAGVSELGVRLTNGCLPAWEVNEVGGTCDG